MKQFRFYSTGMAPTSRKKYLNPLCKSLPVLFTVADIKPGMFSPSVTKRLLSAKFHGTEIIVRAWRGSIIGIKVIDKEQHKDYVSKRREEIKKLRKHLKQLSDDPEVKDYLIYLKKLNDLTGLGYYPKIEFK